MQQQPTTANNKTSENFNSQQNPQPVESIGQQGYDHQGQIKKNKKKKEAPPPITESDVKMTFPVTKSIRFKTQKKSLEICIR